MLIITKHHLTITILKLPIIICALFIYLSPSWAQLSPSDLNFMIGGFYSMSANKGEAELNSTSSSGSG